MSKNKMKWVYLIVGGVGALTLAAAGLFVFTGAASAAGTAVGSGVATSSAGHPARGFVVDGLDWGLPGDGGSRFDGYEEALAEALGIDVEELQAAYQAVRETLIQQAVDEGMLTQEQADALLSGERPEAPAEGERPEGLRGGIGFHAEGADVNALLADELGITVEELQAAQQEAHAAVIAQAVEDGTLTQEEADLMQARSAVQNYVADAMAAAYEDAVQQALTDGAITQAQADLLLENAAQGMGGLGGFFPGPNGFHGHPGMHGDF
jgi:polyhydroxyalkanoate synthesis regulator phasin